MAHAAVARRIPRRQSVGQEVVERVRVPKGFPIGTASAPLVMSAVELRAAVVRSALASNVGVLYSCRLSHVPQSGHLPIHFGCTLPQELQRNLVLVLSLAM